MSCSRFELFALLETAAVQVWILLMDIGEIASCSTHAHDQKRKLFAALCTAMLGQVSFDLAPATVCLDLTDAVGAGVVPEVGQEGFFQNVLRCARQRIQAEDAVVEEPVRHPVQVVPVCSPTAPCSSRPVVTGRKRLSHLTRSNAAMAFDCSAWASTSEE